MEARVMSGVEGSHATVSTPKLGTESLEPTIEDLRMRKVPLAVVTLCVVCVVGVAHAQAAMTTYHRDSIQWKDGPPALAGGSKMVILEGDPAKAGMFTMRIKFPAGMRVSPHTHTQTEHATVVSGALHIGMGEKFDKKSTRVMPAGSFGFWPAGTKHFAYFDVETVLQLHGQGPWTITYVNASDDPRTSGVRRP